MKKIILLLSIFLFIACSDNCEKNFDAEKEKQEILKVMKTQQEGWNSGDWDKYMSGYKKSETIRFAGESKITYGWNTVLGNYKKSYPDKSVMGTLSFSDQDVMVLSPNSAVVFGKWHLKRATDEPWGLYTLVWEKTQDGWKVVHDHTSAAD